MLPATLAPWSQLFPLGPPSLAFVPSQDPENLAWAASATSIEELVLCFDGASPPSAQVIPTIFQWVCWAAGLPRLRLVEVCNGAYVANDVLFKAVREEGEDVKAMLQRLLWDLAGAN